MKALVLTLLLALLPLAFGVWVNTTAPHLPTRAYVATRCTRYCEAHGCPHATAANSPAYFRLRPLHAATVQGLAAAGWKRYAFVNVGFYLVLMPALLLWLSYGAIRNVQIIRRLRRQVVAP